MASGRDSRSVPSTIEITESRLLADIRGSEHKIDAVNVVGQFPIFDRVVDDIQNGGVLQPFSIRVGIGGFSRKSDRPGETWARIGAGNAIGAVDLEVIR